MWRRAFGAAVLVAMGSGCAGLSAIERGEWRRDEIIARERFDEANRTGPLVLNDLQSLTLAVGEVAELTVTEEEGLLELFAQGTAVSWFWGPLVKRDEWVDGQDVVHHESTLFVVGRSVGKSLLRLLVGGENGRSRDLSVTVH